MPRTACPPLTALPRVQRHVGWRCSVGWLGWLLGWLLCSAVWAQTPSFQTLRLHQAEFVADASPGLPREGWRSVQVPAVFDSRAHGGVRNAWLRFAFDLPQVPDAPLVLLVQRVVLTAEFRLNGALLNPGVRFTEPHGAAGTQMLNQPQWIVLPSALFRPGRNELTVRLGSDAVTPAWISGLSLGEPQALRGEYLLRHIPQQVLPQALCMLLLATLLFGLGLWWRERQPLQGLVVTTALLWLLQLGWYLLGDWWLPWRESVLLISALWVAVQWSLMHLLWRLSDGGWPWFARALQIGCALPLLGVLAVLVFEPATPLMAPLMLPVLLLRCLTTALLLRWAWRTRTLEALLLTASELLWFAGPVQLLLVVRGLLPPDPFMLDPACGLPMALVMVGLAARRLARQREQAMLQRQAAVIEERQRMVLDMHDGLGSQLVTALRLARRDPPRPDLAQLLQEALDDLRLIIEAQDGAAQELQSLLGHWKQRNQARIETAGPRLSWDLQALPTPHALSAPQALQVLRILQEALSNALQHGRPGRIEIALKALPDGGSALSIADDGAGLAAQAPCPSPAADATAPAPRLGLGLAGMQRRAQRLGAQLQVQGGPGQGTRVSLHLPRTA